MNSSTIYFSQYHVTRNSTSRVTVYTDSTARANIQYSNVTTLTDTSVAYSTEFDRTRNDVPLNTERTNRLTNYFSCLNPAKLSLLLHRASCRFTKYHTTNKCTNCMSFILNHFFKTLFTVPTCFDCISLIIIREHIQFLAKITC